VNRYRRYFLTGLVVVVPPVFSFYVIYLVGDWLDQLLGGRFRGEWIRPGGIPGLGIMSLLLLIMLVGMLASRTLGRRVVHWWELILARIPILNRVYLGSKQISEALFHQESRVFRKVVLVEYPRKGCWVIAFKTERASIEIETRTGQQLVSVFLPTTPNPTSGYLLLVPESEVIPLDMNVEQGLKMVISAGSVVPRDAQGVPLASATVPPTPSPGADRAAGDP
jgi:uncharacterized membrane protein